MDWAHRQRSRRVSRSRGDVYVAVQRARIPRQNGRAGKRRPCLRRQAFRRGCGLAVNIFLDPLLIFGAGPFPKLGVTGAAIATVTAQFIVTLLFLYHASKGSLIFDKIKIFQKPDMAQVRSIIRIGIPTSAPETAAVSAKGILALSRLSWHGELSAQCF